MNTRVSRRLCFKKIGVLGKTGNIIASALDENTNEAAIFLIIGDGEKAYCRRGSNSGWQLLDQENMASMLQSICHAVANGAAVFKIDERSKLIINPNN